MREVFIYDHVRTPRGRGKPDGGLHEATSVEMSRQLMVALKDRNTLPADSIDEVVMGTVSAAGEQGATLPRIAPLLAGFTDRAPGLQPGNARRSPAEETIESFSHSSRITPAHAYRCRPCPAWTPLDLRK